MPWSSNITCFAKKLKHMKSVFCIANNISWERTIFHVLELYSKIALSNFLSLRNKLFSIRGHVILFICLVALNTALVVLRSSKLVIMCIEALTLLALQKSSNTWKSVFCIANNISFHEKEHLSCTWALLLKLH